MTTEQTEVDTGELAVVSGGAVVAPPQSVSSADLVRAKVAQLRDQLTENYFELGRLMYRINKDALYMRWKGPNGQPYESFAQYVEQEVDFQFRKAKYIMSIWWWFAEELGDRNVIEEVKKIGWAKASLLVGVIDSKNAEQWISKAKSSTLRTLQEECKLALEQAGKKRPRRDSLVNTTGSEVQEPRPSKVTTVTPDSVKAQAEAKPGDVAEAEEAGEGIKGAALPLPLPMSGAPEQFRQGVDPIGEDEQRELRRNWTVQLTGSQKKNVDLALKMASKVAGVSEDGRGFCLDLMATSYLSITGPLGIKDKELRAAFRKEVLKQIEVSFGLRLVALDRVTLKPLFGEDTIDAWLEANGGEQDQD